LSYYRWTYTWEHGRQLKSLSNASTSLSFKYNSDGIRTEKTVNGVHTKYTVFGDKVSFETTGSDKIHYSYDASGNHFSMNLNGTEYYYVRNAQGDITGLIDNAGNLVVSYTYDTWGKLVSTTGSLASTLGVKNPYRYRGYRYDTETGLYYLQSRYYNPEWGRFVNADGLGGSIGDLLSHNMFGYCENNPVNLEDPTGFKPAEGATTYTIIYELIIPARPTSVDRIKTNIANAGKTASQSLMNARIDKYAAAIAAKAMTSTYKLVQSGMSNAFYKAVSTSRAVDLMKTVTGKIGLSSIVGVALSATYNVNKHGWTSEAAGRTAIDGLFIAAAVVVMIAVPGLPWVVAGGIAFTSTMFGNFAKQKRYGGSFWD
jgi:RHS repeat-associated protein